MNGSEDEGSYAIYSAVAESAVRNVTFSLLGIAVLWLIAHVWLSVAKVLFWCGAVIVGLSVLHVLFHTALGVWVLTKGRRVSRWLWAANAVRVGEVAIDLFILFVAARMVHVR